MTPRPNPADQGRVPEFRIELWGYERRSVDAYVAQLAGRTNADQPGLGGPQPDSAEDGRAADVETEISTLRLRVAELEALQANVEPSLPEAGSEAGRLLSEAGALAEGLHRRARELAERTVADAEAHAARVTAHAQETLERAEAMREEAAREAQERVDRAFSDARIEIQRRSASLRADVDRLLEVRNGTLHELARLRGHVEELLDRELSASGSVTHGA